MIKRLTLNPLLVLILAASPIGSVRGAPPTTATPKTISVEEARGRARLLHETIHATLQVVHHEFYREDEALKIPAAALKQVFREVASRQKVELRWLAVNAQAMNTDHQPRNDFEKQAVEALSGGKQEHEQTQEGVYRLASAIKLSSDCLKCHSPNRTSNQDRAAGLIISIPLGTP